ncbi:MAG: serine hydrolase [Cyanobacteria bacterium J06607_13]
MSGFWYSAAIATTTAALFSLTADIATERTRTLSPLQTANSQAQKSHHLDAGAATNPENATPLTGQQRYQQAMTLANQAVVAYQSARQAETLAKQVAFTRQERDLWQQTLELLTSIPTDAVEHAQAARKAVQYRQLLATAEGKLTTADRTFLTQIIQSARVNPQRIHVTLCQLGGPVTQSHRQSKRGHSHSKKGRLNRDRCRDHQGDMPMASPASLIKLPIAIALLDKVATENVDLSSRIYIDPGNFTENAAGANIEVGQEYPLSQVMTRMINESNNIATNQLIDYVGHADIAETLLNRGYTSTLVGHKLAGDRILPKNPGTQTNRATTNDITVMMAHTYSLENPGDEELLKALVSQNDQEFGYQALQDLDPAIKWLGEKTGQNNRVIGSTLAMEVGADRYALTVAIDHSADPHAMRAIIRQVAEYLLAAGSLTETSERSPALPSAALNSEGPEHKDSEEKVQAPAETTS